MSVKSTKISNLKATECTDSTVSLSWSPVSVEGGDITYQVCVKKAGAFGKKNEKAYVGKDAKCTVSDLKCETKYEICVRCGLGDSWSKWSDKITVTTLDVLFAWAKCPDVGSGCKYTVDKESKRIVVKTGGSSGLSVGLSPIPTSPFPIAKKKYYSNIISKTVLPKDSPSAWDIKILNSKTNDGGDIFVGVAPRTIDTKADSVYSECGWYLNCFNSSRYSGPPHHYSCEPYGPTKENGKYIRTGDVITVVMDPSEGVLSFMVNGVDFGPAFVGIPTDKDLVPCVILEKKGDSVEIDTSEAEEKVNKSIPAPTGFKASTGREYDTIDFSWNPVNGASFYQIDSDGYNTMDASVENKFTRKTLPPGIELTFKIRTVKGKEVSEWSEPIKGSTRSDLDFEELTWKSCPFKPNSEFYYTVEENVAVKSEECIIPTLIKGSLPIPLDQVTSWDFKIVNGCCNALFGITEIDADHMVAPGLGGWYFSITGHFLTSGPPHNYSKKSYGSGVRIEGDDVTLRATFDPREGKLSFALNDKDLGVAYKDIPLEKALVPAVKLFHQGDCVGIIPY